MGEGDERKFGKCPHLTSPRGRGISLLGSPRGRGISMQGPLEGEGDLLTIIIGVFFDGDKQLFDFLGGVFAGFQDVAVGWFEGGA